MSCRKMHEQTHEAGLRLLTSRGSARYSYSFASREFEKSFQPASESGAIIEAEPRLPQEIGPEVSRYIDSLQDGQRQGKRRGVRLTARRLSGEGTSCHFHKATFAEDDQIVLALGRVDGDPLRGALVKAAIVGALQSFGRIAAEPSGALDRLNSLLWGINENLRFPFVTCALVYGVIDRSHRSMTYCNAGHRDAFIVLGSEKPTALSPTSEAIGAQDSTNRFSSTSLLDLREVSRLALLAGEYKDKPNQGNGNASNNGRTTERGKGKYASLDSETAAVLSAFQSEFPGAKVFEHAAILIAEFARWHGDGKANRLAASRRMASGPGPPPDPSVFLG